MSPIEAESQRLRIVWQRAVPGSLPLMPWDLLDTDSHARWLALAKDSLRKGDESRERYHAKLEEASSLFGDEP